jgi:hypothetical protein
MSLESKIQELTETVSRLIDALNAHQTNIVTPTPAPVQVAVPVAAAPVVTAPAPAPVAAAPVAAPAPVAAAPAMPTPPTFAAPAAAPAPAGAPFADGKGLIDYVMGAYKALGPQKGAMIQNVLVGLGYQNINDVKPEHYAALYQGVEQLKAS